MKKIIYSSIAVFIAMNVFDFIVHGVILDSAYKETQALWRPDMQSLMWVYTIISLVGAFFFTFIFSKGFEGKGIAEGARYGLYIGIWMSIGMAYGTYAMIAIPYSMAVQWFIYGIIEYVIYGIIVALIFGKKSETPAA
ncbi:MAG: hypothetical protein WCT99_00840 [Bacteroidota bacterium]|jgi:hypothetical protein